MAFQKLEGLIKKNLNRAGITPQVDTAIALEEIMRVLCDAFAADVVQEQVHPLHIKNGVLSLAIMSPPFAQDMKMQEAAIIAELNKRMGKSLVSRIRYLL